MRVVAARIRRWSTTLIVGSAMIPLAAACDSRVDRPVSSPPEADSRAEIDQVTIRVLGPDAHPQCGAAVHWVLGEVGHEWETALTGSDGSVDLGIESHGDIGANVLVSCRGFVTVGLQDVRRSTTVRLTPSVPRVVVVRLGDSIALPDSPARLVGWLEWYDARRPPDPREIDPIGGRDFGPDRQLTFRVDDPGTYLLGIGVETVLPGVDGSVSKSLFPRPFPPLIVVPGNEETVEFHVIAISDKPP